MIICFLVFASRHDLELTIHPTRLPFPRDFSPSGRVFRFPRVGAAEEAFPAVSSFHFTIGRCRERLGNCRSIASPRLAASERLCKRIVRGILVGGMQRARETETVNQRT